MSVYSLLDRFRIPGHWWLPGKPEEKIAGVVSFDPQDGVRLELVGLFASPDFEVRALLTARQLPRLSAILGADADGESYTLHIVDLVDTSKNLFRVAYLLVGRHFSSAEEIRFSSSLVEFSNLEEWSCFQFWRSPKSDIPESFRIEVPNTRATLFRTNAAGLVRELDLSAYAASNFTRRSVEIKPHAHFEINLNEVTDLRAFLSILSGLGQFVTMLVGEPSYMEKVRFYGQGKPADVFFLWTGQKGKEVHAPAMCFPLVEVATSIKMLAENWFSSTPLLSPIYDLLFGTLFNRDSFVQTKFLNLSQALESFHRRVQGGTYLPRTEYLTVQTALNAAVPADVSEPLRRRLSDSIKYANEYSLRKRLKEILRELDVSTVEMLEISDVAGIAELIVKTRNYLTHFDEDSRTTLVDDIAGMHYMNERLVALLFILILKKLGMDEGFAARGVLRRRYFQ